MKLPYLDTVITDFNDDALADMIAVAHVAPGRKDLTEGQKTIRIRQGVAAQGELERRAGLRRLAQVRELASNHAMLNINRQQMLDAHDYAVAEAEALQVADMERLAA